MVTDVPTVPLVGESEEMTGGVEVLAVKAAVTVVAAFMVILQAPVPEQPLPDHPVKVEPVEGEAARATTVP